MKRIVALVATAASFGVLTAAPAQAATTVSISSVALSSTSLVLNGDAGCANRVKVTVRVYDPDGQTTADDLDALVYDGAGKMSDWLLFDEVSRAGARAVFAGWVHSCPSLERPGTYRVAVEVAWLDGLNELQIAAKNAYLAVRRPTRLTYNASPDTVERGGYLAQSGRLMFDRYSPGARYGAPGAEVKFYFRRNGASTYTYKGSAMTDRRGYYAHSFKASDSGMWKAVYEGAATRQPQTVWDEVTVRR